MHTGVEGEGAPLRVAHSVGPTSSGEGYTMQFGHEEC